MTRRLLVALTTALALTACSSDKSPTAAAPTSQYPAVAGTYDVTGTFDGVDGTSFSGVLTLAQPSLDDATLTGTGSVDVTGAVNVTVSGLSELTLTKAGVVSFLLGSASSGETWQFTGTVTGATIAGRHTISTASASLSGPWSAVRR